MYVKQIFTNWLYKYIHKNVLFFKQIFTNYFNYENSIVTFHNQLPIEIWLIIMNYASHVSRIKITLTCKNFHKYNEMYTEVLFDSISPRIDIEPIIVTHLVTNIPFDKHDILKLHFWKNIPDTIQCIQLSTLKFIILPNNFYCYFIPFISCYDFRICDTYPYKRFFCLATNSEKNHTCGRHKILESLDFQPIHSSYITNWEFSHNTNSQYTVILCTRQLFFKKKCVCVYMCNCLQTENYLFKKFFRMPF